MIPRTDFEKLVANIDWSMRPLSESYKKIAVDECLKLYAFRRKDIVCHCLYCGDKFDYDGNERYVVCPHCGKKLEVIDTKKRTNNTQFYWNLLDVFKGLQVLRGFYIETKCVINNPYVVTTFVEVARTYFKSNGEYVNLSYPYVPMTWNYSISSSKMTFDRTERRTITIKPHIRKLIPELKRIGYFNIDGDSIVHLRNCLSDSHYQTLVEANHKEFVQGYNQYGLYCFWNQIRLCIRNKYVPSDLSIWKDTLYSAKELGLDLMCPKYVCPENLTQMHDQLCARVERKRTKEKIERERNYLEKAQEDNKEFEQEMMKFSDLKINKGNINITPLITIVQYLIEGEEMHHCVYTNRYYQRRNSLILSAKDNDDNRIATIEYDMKNKSILQIRGKHNSKVEQYDEITNLILSNKSKINKIYKMLTYAS